MLKLTRHRPDGTVYVAPQHIAAIEQLDSLTAIWFAGDHSPRFVRETPEEILAMEQMVLLFNPAMIINGDQVRRL